MNALKNIFDGRRWLQALVGLVLLCSVVAYYLCFNNYGTWLHLVTVTKPSLHWLGGMAIRYGLGILRDAALIWAFAVLGRRALKVDDALRGSLLLWIGGLLMLLLPIAVNGSVKYPVVYDQVFYPIRSSMTLLCGIFWMLLVQPYLLRVMQKQWGRTAFWIVLTLPIIFGQDLFSINSGVSFYAVFVLASVAMMPNAGLPKHQKIWVFGVPLLMAVLILPMGITFSSGAVPIATAGKFIGLMSPLTLVPAMVLVNWLQKFTGESEVRPQIMLRLAIILGTVLMAVGPYPGLTNGIVTILKNRFNSLGRLWLVATVVILVIAVVLIATIACLITTHMNLWRHVSVHWHVDLPAAVLRLRQWRRVLREIMQEHGRPLLAVGVLLLTQLFSALLMNQSFRSVENIYNPNLNIFSLTLGYLFPRMLGGTLILLAAYWVLLALSNRYWFSLTTVTLLTVIFAIANRVKIELRSAPIVVSDLNELRNMSELLGMINPLLLIVSGVAIVAAIGFIILIELRTVNAQQSFLTRLAKLAVALTFIFSLGQMNHDYSFGRNVMKSFSIYMDNNNEIRFAQWHGPVLQYISGLDVKAMANPEGYSKKNVAKVVARYKKEAATINKTRRYSTKDVTVLFNLSESYADPTRIPELKFNTDPASYVQKMKRETTSGYMMSYGYGGGTADMEYMTLTGMALGTYDTSLNTPYTQLVPKLSTAPNIGNDFSYASAIHPYTGGFYNRIAVYKKFQFNKFAYLGSKYKIYDQKKWGGSPYNSDLTSYANALRQIKAKRGGQFINLMTIQNHMPYNSWYKTGIQAISNNSVLNARKSTLETYAQGVKYTDEAVKKFRRELDQLNKPIIWVFYGDHLPGIYPELTDNVMRHQTDYFVYANKYAREHGASTTQTNNKYVGADNFIALALAKGNVKVNAYNALLTKVQRELPAQWQKTDDDTTSSTVGINFINEQGQNESYKELSAKQKRLYHDYQLILYDINVGKQYSLKDGIKAQ